MSTMAIAFNGTFPFGQYLGDTIVSIRVAWMFAQSYSCSRYLLALSPKHEVGFLWDKFIRTFNAQVVYDTFDPGNADKRFESWNKWRKERHIDGTRFDIYKELYRRIDGGHRQGILCGEERGLGRKNVFDYFYYGQDDCPNDAPIGGNDFDGPKYFDHPAIRPARDVFLAPYAKCQGNAVFTFDYWTAVVHKLIEAGKTVTVNYSGGFCEDLNGHPNYRKIFPAFRQLQEEICQHRIVTCGNTGVGWMAAACGVPLLAMQPIDSHIQDYRYEWCGVKSLVEFLDTPDADYCAARLIEECEKMLVFTTGCYDILHAGHIKHLEESRSLGNRLVVGLNSDASIRRLKGDGRPAQNQDQRAAVLRGCKYVDEVIIFDGDNAMSVIEQLHPDIITNGPDHKADEVVGKALVEGYGGRVVITGGERTVSTSKIIKKLSRAGDIVMAVKDAVHLSPNPAPKLKLACDELLSVLSLEGAIADVGCYRGAYALAFKRLTAGRDIHLFDTFAGNPHEDPLCHHRKGEWGADLTEVKRTVGEDAVTHFHPGMIQDTAQNTGPFCFVLVDCDTYQATKAAIALFWPQLVPGGKMVFDDIPWEPCAGVEKAVDEVFPRDQQRRYPEAHACVVTKGST